MSRKIGVVSALSALAVGAGVPHVALTGGIEAIDQRCEEILQIRDRSILQSQLELLLELNPDDPCIPLLVSVLGASAIAQVPPTQIPPTQLPPYF